MGCVESKAEKEAKAKCRPETSPQAPDPASAASPHMTGPYGPDPPQKPPAQPSTSGTAAGAFNHAMTPFGGASVMTPFGGASAFSASIPSSFSGTISGTHRPLGVQSAALAALSLQIYSSLMTQNAAGGV